MTKIGYLVSDLSAPSHTFVRREITALQKLGIEIAPYTIHGSSHGPDRHTVLGHPFYRYLVAVLQFLIRSPATFIKVWSFALRHRPPGLRNLIWAHFHFVEAVFLARLLRADGCEHLHNHFANSGATVGLLASKLSNCSWSLTLHGISETDYPSGATLKGKILEASFVACASRFMMAQGMRIVPRTHWSKFLLVRCGVDMSALPVSKPQTPHSDPIRFLCVGRLSAEKGYFGLIEALADLPAEAGRFTLRIVGDGDIHEDLETAIGQSSLAAKATLLGALCERDTLQEIAKCDVLILPSLMEGLPVVLIEARALGKPVIASCLAGIPELVSHNETGLLFAPADWRELRAQIMALLTQPELRIRLAAQADASFPEQFRIEDAAQLLAERFREVTEKDQV